LGADFDIAGRVSVGAVGVDAVLRSGAAAAAGGGGVAALLLEVGAVAGVFRGGEGGQKEEESGDSECEWCGLDHLSSLIMKLV
jgi:hypothetical protein